MHRKAREDVEVGFEVWFESLKPGTQRRRDFLASQGVPMQVMIEAVLKHR